VTKRQGLPYRKQSLENSGSGKNLILTNHTEFNRQEFPDMTINFKDALGVHADAL